MRAVIASALILGLGLPAYIGARVAVRASAADVWGRPVGAGSLDGAVRAGTLAGLYRGDCPGTPYLERLAVHRIGPLLGRRVAYTDRFALRVVGADTLALDDGTEATGGSAVRRSVPEAFWLVRDGERVCRFALDPSTRSDGLPDGARVTEP